MSAIKLHLEDEEMSAVERYAAQMGVKPEDIAYAALNRLMLAHRDPLVCTDIMETRAWRGENLPLWSDSARSVHAYEGRTDQQTAPSIYF